MSELPQGWAPTTLGAVSEYVTSGSRDWSKFYASSGALFVRTQDINTNRLTALENIARVSLPERVEGKRTLIKTGDILITITGANVGKCARVADPIPEAYVSQSVALVRLMQPTMGPFVHYQLIAPATGADLTLLQKSAYGLGRPVLSLDNVRDVALVIAPPDEQRRIADKLDAVLARVDVCRERLDRVPAVLKKFREAVLEAAVSGRLTEEWREAGQEPAFPAQPGKPIDQIEADSDPFSVPTTWTWTSLLSLTTNHDSRRVPVRASDRATRRGAYPYYGAFGVIDSIDDFLYEGTYLLVAEDGKNLESRYRPIALTASGRFWVNNHAHVLQAKDGVCLRHLQHYLNSGALDLRPYLTGIDQVKLTRGALDIVPVPLPPLSEAVEIVRRVDELFALADALERRYRAVMARVEKLTPAVLSKAFRGELVPQEPNDEPASVLLERIKKQREAPATQASTSARVRARRTTPRKSSGGRRGRASSA